MQKNKIFKMFKLKYLILLFIFGVMVVSVHAQTKLTMKGIVLDKDTKDPIVGAHVIEVNAEGRSIGGGVTHSNGEFFIKIRNAENKIHISFIGYKSKLIDIDQKKSFLAVELIEDIETIEDVVVKGEMKARVSNGYMPIEQHERTDAVATIQMKSVEQVQATSIGEAIQGRLAGVDISPVSGDPGAGISIRIRGTSSINGSSEPLVVVDGIPFDTQMDDDFETSSATAEEYSALVDVAVEDIISIDVLKDAAATAVWGSRAANGVLLINTKRGKRGKPSITYSYKLSLASAPKTMPLLNGQNYALTQLDARYNSSMDQTGLPPSISGDAFFPILYDPNYKYFNEYSQNTDWVDAVTQIGHTNNHNLAVSGGGEKARYRLSFGYTDQTGTTIGPSLKRLTTRLNLDYQLSKKLSFYTNFSLTTTDQISNYSGILGMAYQKAPNMAIYEMLDKDTPSNTYFSAYLGSTTGNYVIENYQGNGSSWYNPVAMGTNGVNKKEHLRVITTLGLRHHITKNLLLDSYVSYDVSGSDQSKLKPWVATGQYSWNSGFNAAQYSESESSNIQHRTKLIHTLHLGDEKQHKITSMLAYDIYTKENSAFRGASTNLASSNLSNHSSESPITSLYSGSSSNRMTSFIANGHYNFRDRYMFGFSVRADGSSRLSDQNRWGYFPSVSAAYRVAEEPFLDNWIWLDELKIRASYGITGNLPSSSYAYFGSYSNGNQYMDLQGIIPSTVQLNDLKWETVTQSNIGMDISLFENKVFFGFDYYSKVTKDLLWRDYGIPSITGYSKYGWTNFGNMKNSGVEFATQWKAINNDKVRLNLSFNISKNKNEVLTLPENIELEKGNLDQNGQYARRIVVGDALGTFYGYVYDGVYSVESDTYAKDSEGNVMYNTDGAIPYRFNDVNGYIFQAGDAKYRDINKDGLINKLDVVRLGDSNPDFSGGFGASLKLYKRVGLNTFFHYRYGYDVVNNVRMSGERMWDKNNQLATVENRWRQAGDISDIPRALYNYGYNWLGSSRFVEDASFLRLKTVSFSYDIKKMKVGNINFRDGQLYCTFYNLYTWTNYSGQDPQVSISGSDPFFVGVDNAKTAPARSVTFGCRMTF